MDWKSGRKALNLQEPLFCLGIAIVGIIVKKPVDFCVEKVLKNEQ
jgi:hypothetical protein